MEKNSLNHMQQVIYYPYNRKYITQVPFSQIMVEFWVFIDKEYQEQYREKVSVADMENGQAVTKNLIVPCTVSFCRAWNIPSEGLQALDYRRILELEKILQASQWVASPEMDNLQPLSAQEYTQEKAKLEAQMEAQMEALKAAQAELERRYCLGAPFQPGDKVQVTNHKGKTRFVFIDKVMPGYFYKNAPGFRYDIVKCKTDGTPAAVRVILSGTEEESMVKV